MNSIGRDRIDPIRIRQPEEEENPSGLSGSTATIFLSISLILVTYFIFLNAAGRPAESLSERAVLSVLETFRGEPPAAASDPQTKLGKVKEQIEKLAIGYRLSGRSAGAPALNFELEFTPSEVFTDSGEIRAAALDSLSSIFQTVAAAGLSLSIDVPFAPAGTGTEYLNQAFAAAAGRASALNRLFLDRGGDQSMISGGGRVSADPNLPGRLLVSLPEPPRSRLLRQPNW